MNICDHIGFENEHRRNSHSKNFTVGWLYEFHVALSLTTVHSNGKTYILMYATGGLDGPALRDCDMDAHKGSLHEAKK